MKVGDLVSLRTSGENMVGIIVKADPSGWWWVADGNTSPVHTDGAILWPEEEMEVISECG